MRIDNRAANEARPLKITRNYIKHAEGSVLIEVGKTRVICTASLEDKVPPFLRGSGQGWITAEYAMLPRATPTRNVREVSKGRPSGRTLEIQRLIGRSLRAVVDLKRLGERTLWFDCDVLQADGGTRTAAITGAFVALVDALANDQLSNKGKFPVTDFLAATSVGIINNEPMLDLCFSEDSQAQVDMNVVMTGSGKFVEVQGTAEGQPYSADQLFDLLALAEDGVRQLIAQQRLALGEIANLVGSVAG